MTRMPSKPQSTPVGLLKNLSQGAAASVACRLLWPNDPESQVVKSQAKVWNDVAVGLGLAQDRNPLHCFHQRSTLCALPGDRSMNQHRTNCHYLGPDKACFSQVIVPKTKSQLTDILLNASLLARANTVPLITSLANDCGPVLKQMLFDIPKASNQNSKPSLCLKVTLH